MSSSPSSLRSLPAVRAPAPIARWFASKSDAERRSVVAIGVVGVVALGWLLLWQPMIRDTAALRAAKGADTAALAAARRMSEEVSALSAKAELPPASDARAALERTLAQYKLGGTVTQIDWQESRARVVFASIGFDSLVALLEALQRDAQLRAVEATITARVEPGTVRAELTLAR